MKVVHYAKKPFDIRAIKVENEPYFCKPGHALWFTPAEEGDWASWCEGNWPRGATKLRYRVECEVDDKNIVKIDRFYDLAMRLPWIVEELHPFEEPPIGKLNVDWEKLAEQFVGIYITQKAINECRDIMFTKPGTVEAKMCDCLYAWDVASVALFDETVIQSCKIEKYKCPTSVRREALA